MLYVLQVFAYATFFACIAAAIFRVFFCRTPKAIDPTGDIPPFDFRRPPGTPSISELDAPTSEITITSKLAFVGEPPFAPAHYWSVVLNLGLASLLLLILASIDSNVWNQIALQFLGSGQVTIAIMLVFGIVAIVVGALREFATAMMNNALGIPVLDSNGVIYLSYIGEVPGPRWAYRAWPRVFTFLIYLFSILIFAWSGGVLAERWFEANVVDTLWWLMIGQFLILWIAGRFIRRMLEKQSDIEPN